VLFFLVENDEKVWCFQIFSINLHSNWNAFQFIAFLFALILYRITTPTAGFFNATDLGETVDYEDNNYIQKSVAFIDAHDGHQHDG